MREITCQMHSSIFPFFGLFLHRIHAYSFFIFLQSCQVLQGLRELSILHAFSHVHFAYMRSYLWFQQAQTSAMAVVLHRMYIVCCTLTRFLLGMTVGGLVVDAHFKSRWTISTNWMVHFILMLMMAVLTSFGTVSQVHATDHVLAVARAILGHLIGWLAGTGDLGHRQLLIIDCLS